MDIRWIFGQNRFTSEYLYVCVSTKLPNLTLGFQVQKSAIEGKGTEVLFSLTILWCKEPELKQFTLQFLQPKLSTNQHYFIKSIQKCHLQNPCSPCLSLYQAMCMITKRTAADSYCSCEGEYFYIQTFTLALFVVVVVVVSANSRENSFCFIKWFINNQC